jgi:LysR family transcriptional regulator, hydrogen peroxide-inducible genes activator
MNLNQLRFAQAVAQTGSFTKAATHCNVTQPTLSNGVAQLEAEFGERLFARTTRKVTPTAFGAHIMPYVLQVISAQASLVHQSEAFLKPDKRLIRIGISPLVNASLFSTMVEPFRQKNPDVDVVLREMNMADLNRMLGEQLLDVVIGVADDHKASCVSVRLYDESLRFIPSSAKWPSSPRISSVQIKDIANETYVMVPDACGLARATRALFRSQRRKLKEYSGEAMSYQVLQEWATLGIGAAILPMSKVASNTKAALPIADKSGHDLRIRFEAVWLRDAGRPPHLVAFFEHLRHVAAKLVAGLNNSAINQSNA